MTKISFAAICFAASLILFLAAPRTSRAQAGAMQKSPAANSSAKATAPFVIELYSTKVRFETDGTGERVQEVRVRAMDDAGIKQLHTLTFNYNSAHETFALAYLRIAKPDGSVTEEKLDAIAKMIDDQPSPAVKDAPSFKEIREVHVTVPPIAIGDTLSYEADTKIVKPAVPGEFWYSQNFLSNTRARDEELQIDLPADRAVHLKTAPQFPPAATTSGARKLYAWKRTDTEAAPAKASADEDAEGKSKPPGVVLTSFANWEAAGKWLASIESPGSRPASAVAAKVEELTSGKKTDAEKIEALYDFVAKQIRLVSIPFDQLDFAP
ncbi:MAG: DUF3857 domain-containing protein, partial [Candidatus Acidiferrales bacterium]